MNIKQTTQSNKHAMVIGASMAGLMAARMLSDHFEQVTIIERDRLFSTTNIPRTAGDAMSAWPVCQQGSCH
jgi:2-polyprenyl-6-methoxyphenol hydroxylase-like FAD-dependent oxidoreductase